MIVCGDVNIYVCLVMCLDVADIRRSYEDCLQLRYHITSAYLFIFCDVHIDVAGLVSEEVAFVGNVGKGS